MQKLQSSSHYWIVRPNQGQLPPAFSAQHLRYFLHCAVWSAKNILPDCEEAFQPYQTLNAYRVRTRVSSSTFHYAMYNTIIVHVNLHTSTTSKEEQCMLCSVMWLRCLGTWDRGSGRDYYKSIIPQSSGLTARRLIRQWNIELRRTVGRLSWKWCIRHVT